jgi:hypothetical protein
MLAAITDQLRDKLSDRGVPYKVFYGPERLTPGSLAQSHIVVFRDRAGGDTYLGAQNNQQNPPVVNSQTIRGRIRIFAHSTLTSANVWDHERVADRVADQVVIALRVILVERKNPEKIVSGRLLTSAELGETGQQRWPGVVYEIRFGFNRAIFDVNYADEAAGEATFGSPGIKTVGNDMETDTSQTLNPDLPSATTRTGTV